MTHTQEMPDEVMEILSEQQIRRAKALAEKLQDCAPEITYFDVLGALALADLHLDHLHEGIGNIASFAYCSVLGRYPDD